MRLAEDALAAKDTSSWQEGLERPLPGLPSPLYIARSSQLGAQEESENANTKVKGTAKATC